MSFIAGIWRDGMDDHVLQFEKDLIDFFYEKEGVSYIRMPEIQVILV